MMYIMPTVIVVKKNTHYICINYNTVCDLYNCISFQLVHVRFGTEYA